MLARKSLLIFLTNAVGGAFGFVTAFFMARYMGPDPVGMFGFAYAIVGIGSTFAKLGVDTAHIKRVSEGQDIGRCLAVYLVLKGALILVFTLGLLVVTLFWSRSQGFHDATSLGVMTIVILFGAVAEWRFFQTNTFDALMRTAKTQTLFLAEHVVRAPLLIVAALLYGHLNGRWVPFSFLPEAIAGATGLDGPVGIATGGMWIGAAHLGGIVVSVLVGVWLFWRGGYDVGKFDPVLMKDYIHFAAPVAIGSALYLVANRIDAFMIGYFWSATETGWYVMAQKISTLLLVIPIAIRTLFFPLMSELATSGERDAARDVALTAQRYIGIVVLGLTMFLIAWPEKIIHIVLSNEFLPAAPTLAWLGIYTIFFSLTSVASTTNLGHGRPVQVTYIAIFAALLNIVLNLIFVPSSILGVPLLGMRATGAAFATAISEFTRMVLHMMLAKRLTGNLLLGPSLPKHVVAAVSVGLALHFGGGLPITGGLDRWWELALGGLAGGLLYLFVLYLLRELSRKDVLLVVDLLHPGKMANYVRGELRPKTRR